MSFIFDEYIELCQILRSKNKPFVTATLVDKVNSVPQDIGAKIVISFDGIEFGTIGGGALEKYVIDEAYRILENRKEKKVLYKDINLNKDLNMTCGGKASIVFEKMLSKENWNITVFGAGHVSQALIKILLNLDCFITCVDIRQEYLEKLPNSRKLKKVFVNHYTDYIENLHKSSYIVIMTSGHKYDAPILIETLEKKSFPYIGVIGSKTKRAKFDKQLKELNIKEDFYCPIGEKVGSNNPFEIAISIASQLLKTRDNLS